VSIARSAPGIHDARPSGHDGRARDHRGLFCTFLAMLEGKVVAITGASSGIGEATALMYAEQGAAVALAARRADRIEALAARIEDDGGRAIALPTDVGDERQARAFVEHAYEHLGRLDILVNNAGVMLLGPVEGADTEQWRQMVHVNLFGVLYCTHAVLPLMREQGGGHIVNVSSVAGRRAAAGAAVYNLTKFGLNAFSEALRQEALHAGIRVTIVEPGFVETELQGHNAGNEMVMAAMEKARERIGQILRPEDIATAIVGATDQPEHVNVAEVLVVPTRER
jgi:clavulanate-9-aldehyde reducatase